MNYIKIFLLSTMPLVVAVSSSCNDQAIDNEKVIQPPPPPLLPEIDFLKLCESLTNTYIDSSLNKSIYLIYDSVGVYNRVIFESILNEDYDLLARPILHELDTMCIKPIYDSIIKSAYGKNNDEIVREISNKVNDLRKQVGLYQIRRNVYYTADKYPIYPGGTAKLYHDVISLKNVQKRKSDKNGRVMFYFVIDTLGNVGDIAIHEHVDNETDSLTCIIMKHLPSQWSAALFKDQPVQFWGQYAIEW